MIIVFFSPKQGKTTSALTGKILAIYTIFAGISRKGPWRCARTKATQIGISNSWLTKMGLICIKDLWVKIQYPVTTR